MLYAAATHLRPVNLVGTQPFFGAQGFQEKVCNKARAYLDCQTEHPCHIRPKAEHTHTHVLSRGTPSPSPPLPWMVRSILGCCHGRRRPGEHQQAIRSSNYY